MKGDTGSRDGVQFVVTRKMVFGSVGHLTHLKSKADEWNGQKAVFPRLATNTETEGCL